MDSQHSPNQLPNVPVAVGPEWLNDPTEWRGKWLEGARAFWCRKLEVPNVRLVVRIERPKPKSLADQAENLPPWTDTDD